MGIYMNKRISVAVSWLCRATILFGVLSVVLFALRLPLFADLAMSQLPIPIQWKTVERWQWGGLLALTTVFMSIGLLGLYYLQRAFTGFAEPQPFNLQNSANLRRFSVLLLIQVILKPVYMGTASVLLSLNHPAGEKVLAISFGSDELSTLVLGLILWVISDLLVDAQKLHSENQQFV